MPDGKESAVTGDAGVSRRSTARLLDQMELQFEELETTATEAEAAPRQFERAMGGNFVLRLGLRELHRDDVPGKPDPTKMCLKGDFDPSQVYDLIYTARDPIVLGLGVSAIHDGASFFPS
jgi:hypothetical protein